MVHRRYGREILRNMNRIFQNRFIEVIFMIYAVKSVENSEVNKIYADWVSCKDLVWGKSAVYKSFPDNEYEAANKFS